MAKRGDIVECSCGALQVVPGNLRVPLHKPPGSAFTCKQSGVPADHWDAVSRCSACEATDSVRNAAEGARYPYGCAACGAAGTLLDFIDKDKLEHQGKQAEAKKPGRHRFEAGGARQPAPKPTNPPRCPACRGTTIVRSGAALACVSCGRTGSLGDFVAREAAPAPLPAARAALSYLPVTSALVREAERAAEAAGHFLGASKKVPVAAVDLRADIESTFSGRLASETFDRVYGLAESRAKRAFASRMTLMGSRYAYHPMLDAFQAGFDELLGEVAPMGAEATDLAYLLYWGVLEQECARGGVAFRREDMAERGL